MTYDEFEYKITRIIKIRSTNYRMTSNDIHYLIEYIYDDICNTVVLDTYDQHVTIDNTTNSYDLDTLYTGSKDLFEVVSIKTVDGYPVRGFRHVDNNVYKYDVYVADELSNQEKIVFTRIVKPKLAELSDTMYTMLTPAIAEGIVYFTQDALPNPTASGVPAQETNIHFQRYEKAKTDIINKLPQRQTR